jgi:pantoate kinase
MARSIRANRSRTVYVPCAVSSFFEICDRDVNGSLIKDTLRIGSRGGGFVVKRGTVTTASKSEDDVVIINKRRAPEARTTLRVISLMRERFALPPVKVSHNIEPPIGSGFGTSGSGGLGAAVALADLFGLNLTLAQTAAFAHTAEVESLTGLGTVISLASGSGAVGLVTEPGSYSIGQVDSIIIDPKEYLLICACFGPIEKSSVLGNDERRRMVNQFGRDTLEKIVNDPSPATLLKESRIFASRSGISSEDMLKLSDIAVKLGAIGATQNMIGNAVHCLVRKNDSQKFLKSFQKRIPRDSIFATELVQSAPKFL